MNIGVYKPINSFRFSKSQLFQDLLLLTSVGQPVVATSGYQQCFNTQPLSIKLWNLSYHNLIQILHY